MASWVSSAVSFIAGSAASAVIEKIVDAGFAFFGNHMHPGDGEAELKRIEKDLPQIKSALGVAEALKAKDPSYGKWFEQFRRAVDASEEVLDELEYKKLEEEAEKQEEARGSTSRPKKQKTNPISDETLGRLRVAVSMLDQATRDVDLLLKRAKSLGIDGFSESWKASSKVFRPETTSFLVENEVFGRDDEKAKIISWLKQSTAEALSVFGIVGMGGLGKTTLAQFAYQEIESNYFDHTIWVCVSIEFSFEGLTRKILGEVGESNCGDKPLNALQEVLKKKIQSKKIFLILDDIWDDVKYRRGWEQFIAPLKFAQEGSKILFTSREKSVANLLAIAIRAKHEEPLILRGLKEQDLRSLFYNYAFHGYNPENHADLHGLGDQIIKKLRGSPLAAKVLGSLLNSNLDYTYWGRILKHSSVLNIDEAKDVVEILKLSYYHLPADLQVCFRFCSIFPQDYKFEKDELIKMWIATGFIQQQQCEVKQLEDVGEDCFNHLVRKSFFQYFNSSNGDRYVMHDLIHDLAQSVSNGECCRVEPNYKPLVIHESVRHVSVHESEIERISHLENLHSLIITSYPHMAVNPNPFVLPKEIIKNSLRLLQISTSRDCQLPEGISYLVHLRYLSVHTSQSMLIFAAIHKLYNLQVLYLDLPGVNIASSDLGVEPSRINNLVRLRYMRLPEKLLKTIHGVHKMTSLRELTFFVGEGNGHYINELGTLKDLRKLYIHNIENVRDPAEALSANLQGKKNLRLLSLNWSLESNPNNPEQIIDNLQANPDLMELIIQNYKGQRAPRWIEDSRLLNLSVLTFRDCPNLDKMFDLPLSLTKFRVEKVGLTTLPNLFQNANCNTSDIATPNSSLKIVEIKECPKLESLDGFLQQGNVNLQNIEKLTIEDCWKLTRCPTLPYSLTDLEVSEVALSSLPNLPLSLTGLKICDVLLSALPEYNKSSDSSGGPSTESLQSPLRTVTIENCPFLTSLSGFLQQEYIDFQSLKFMYIRNCKNLVELPIGAFGKFVSLRRLEITNCPMLVAVDNQREILPITLKCLSIKKCGKLDVQLLESASRLTTLTSVFMNDCANVTHIPCLENTLPATLEKFTALEELHISRCELLEEIKELPTSLRSLSVHCVKSLKSLPPTMKRLISLKELYIRGCELLEEIQELPTSLRILRVDDAKSLKSLPPTMTSLIYLEQLYILGCELLEEIQELPTSLRILRVHNAKSLKSLPPTMTSLISLERLDIWGCELLEEIQELPTSLRILRVHNAKSLKSLPPTMTSLIYLEQLYILGCELLEEIQELPTSLRILRVHNAKSLKSLLTSIASLTSLEELDISQCKLQQEIQELPASLKILRIQGDAKSPISLPTTMASLSSLEELRIMGCELLGEIPELPPSLRILKIWVQDTDSLKSLRATMASITALKELRISGCKLLEEIPVLPTSLRILEIRGANALKSLCPKMACLPALEELYISGCESLEETQELPNSLKTLRIYDANSLKSLRTAMASLTALEKLSLSNCELYEEIWELHPSLRFLTIRNANSLKSLPATLGSLTALEKISIWSCKLLEEIQELPASLSILEIWGANSLKSLPATMASLTALKEIQISKCELLEEIQELPASLRILKIQNAKFLKSLPATMASLLGLRELNITEADLLEDLPELPPSLNFKYIARSDGTVLCT